MTDLISRFKAFRERRRERLILSRARKGREKEISLKQRELRLQEASKTEITKQTRIAEVREAQLRRAKAEAGIARARSGQIQSRKKARQARKVPRSAIFFTSPTAMVTPKARRKPRSIRLQQPRQVMQAPRPSPLAFAPSPFRPITKKKQPPNILGKFRVL